MTTVHKLRQAMLSDEGKELVLTLVHTNEAVREIILAMLLSDEETRKVLESLD